MNILGRKRWEPTVFREPLQIGPSQLKSIGTDKAGREWFSSSWGELRSRPTPVPVDDVLPGPVIPIDVDGVRYYQTFEAPRPPGTFATMATPVVVTPKAQAAPRPVDSLSTIGLLNGSPSLVGEPARIPIRGAEAIVERLAQRGVKLALSGASSSIVVLAPGGRPYPGVMAAVDVATPLLLPYLVTGRAPDCGVTRHAKATEAITVSGTTPWCATCSPRT